MDNKNELLPEVDNNGNVIGSLSRAEAHGGSMRLHPVVHLHVFNKLGELYLQKRPKWKDIQPGKWDTACGGHVDYGETIDYALKREVFEELGINDYTPQYLTNYIFKSNKERELINVFITIYDGTIRPNTKELEGGRFWSKEEIKESLYKGIFTPNFVEEYLQVVLPILKDIAPIL